LDGYRELSRAVLRKTYRDLCRGAGGGRRGTYLSARFFLDTPLFGVLCRLAGVRPGFARQEMLRRAAAHRTRAVKIRPGPPGPLV